MKQRLGIAMALLPDPEIMVLDEPVNGLDPEGIVEVRNLLKQLREERGITILISSHLLAELSELCTDFAIIDKGVLVECLSKEQLEEQCRSYIEVATDDEERLATVLEQQLGITNNYRCRTHDPEIPYTGRESGRIFPVKGIVIGRRIRR